MSFYIINGRNSNYPCIPELSEQYDTGCASPFCDMMMRVNTGQYPSLNALPDDIPELFSVPYPDELLVCNGDFNNGYPYNVNLSEAERVTFSRLFIHGKEVKRMFFEGSEIENAFCNGDKVFYIYYLKRKGIGC